MNAEIYKKLYDKGLINQDTFDRVVYKQDHNLISVFWELKTLLYLGVLLLSSGLGMLIYKNIDTIGHQVILLFIALISIGCFAYCFKNRRSFNREKVQSAGPLADYALLLGCLSLLIFLGYIQFQYHIFGNHYGMATLIPAVILFLSAYKFDHLGVLGLAITTLALWMGVAISPSHIFSADFYNTDIIYSYLCLGTILLVTGYVSGRYNFKKHFKFNYFHVGLNTLFISLIAGYLHEKELIKGILFLLVALGIGYILYRDAVKDGSLYFTALITIYVYIAFSCIAIKILDELPSFLAIYMVIFYFVGSTFFSINLVKYINRSIKGK